MYCRRSRFTSLSMVFRSPGYVGECKCTVGGLGLLVCLWFLPRLRRRVQVYCRRSRFTSLSMVPHKVNPQGVPLLSIDKEYTDTPLILVFCPELTGSHVCPDG